MFDRDLDIPAGPFTIRGNQNLVPEKAWTYESGWEGSLLNQKLHIVTNVFYTQLKNPIGLESFPAPPATVYVINNGTVYSVGEELELSYKLTNDLSLKSDYTYINAASRSGIDPYSGYYLAPSQNMSKHQVGLGASYTRNAWTIDAYAKWVDKYTDSGEGTGKIPSYWEPTIRLAYAFKFPGMKMKEKDASIELVASDFMGARSVESPHQYVREPLIYSGLKIKF